jgi:hypothetical protein
MLSGYPRDSLAARKTVSMARGAPSEGYRLLAGFGQIRAIVCRLRT